MQTLLPARCVLCGDQAGADALCDPCAGDLPWLGTACPRCALPGADPGTPCGACQARPPPWTRATAALRYDFPVDRLVQRLKFRRDLAAGAALGQAMARHPPRLVPEGEGRGDDVTDHPRRHRGGPWPRLVPVPLHRFREAHRGFNQAMELTLHLSRRTGWPIENRGLHRIRSTAAQAGLDREARRRNLDGAFHWGGRDPAPRYAVLVDDVMTTGATVAACARALRRGGAVQVTLWVAARAAPD